MTEAGAVGMPELFHLGFPLAPVHAAVDLRHLADVAEPFKTPHQILQRVAVLGEDQPLFLGCPLRPLRPVLQHLPELHELRFVAVVQHLPRHAAQPGQRLYFRLQVLDGCRDHRPKHLGLEVLVGLADHAFAVVVVRAVFVEIVPAALDAPVSAGEIIKRRLAGLQVGGVAREFLDAPLEGAQQRPSRTRQPPLKHAQGEPRRAGIAERLAEGAREVVRGGVVERLLARAQVVAEGVALALAVERPALQVHHLFLGAADEVAGAGRGRKAPTRLAGGEDVRVEQSPEVVVGRILAHVRRGGEQQKVSHAPRQAAVLARRGGAARQRFRQLVALRLVDAAPHRLRRQLVRFVEHHQVVGRGLGAAQPVEGGAAGQRVQRHDGQVAPLALERVAGAGVLPRNDAELQAKQRAQFALPVPHQARRRHHQHAPDAASREHLAHRQAGHDGLAGAGVVRQQKAQRVLAQTCARTPQCAGGAADRCARSRWRRRG